ncbi:hypothetical protein [Myxosarcina sp. GI1]|uniref:hypothetical protein n=1 Tax=Myxosarcina sp. GI1 TaxID=1541065 RepID=UPI0012E07262|nr:hypothetical protein [Myxosarcina sp. GI1]
MSSGALVKLRHPDITVCDVEGFRKANYNIAHVKATKVVVEPWRGRHSVYAIFIVPMLYESGYPVLLDIKNVTIFCRRIVLVSKTSIDEIFAPPNSTVLKLHLRTRTALWLQFVGKINDLQQTKNWTLTYSYYPNCISTCKNQKQTNLKKTAKINRFNQKK